MQFSLRTLLAGMALVAMGTYALMYATDLWAAVTYTLCVGVLLAAIVFACAASGRARFYWLGFGIFGWGYLVVLHSPMFDMQQEPHNWQLFYEGPPLVSRMVASWMYFKVMPLVHKPPEWDQSGRRTTNNSRHPNDINFSQVFHSLFALLFALLGGSVGLFAHWRYRRDN